MRATVVVAVALLLAAGGGGLIALASPRATMLAGGALILVGLPLLALARWQLGAAFAFTPKAKGLVTQGLYSRIPHPMYVFLDTALLGGIILLREAWLLAIWGLLLLAQVLQARREASILEQAFGDAYREYRKSTWW